MVNDPHRKHLDHRAGWVLGFPGTGGFSLKIIENSMGDYDLVGGWLFATPPKNDGGSEFVSWDDEIPN